MRFVIVCVVVFACECFCCLMRLCAVLVMYCVMLYGFVSVCCRCLCDSGLSVLMRFACDVWYDGV